MTDLRAEYEHYLLGLGFGPEQAHLDASRAEPSYMYKTLSEQFPSDAQANAEANRRWPHAYDSLRTASARTARRSRFMEGVEWARTADPDRPVRGASAEFREGIEWSLLMQARAKCGVDQWLKTEEEDEPMTKDDAVASGYTATVGDDGTITLSPVVDSDRDAVVAIAQGRILSKAHAYDEAKRRYPRREEYGSDYARAAQRTAFEEGVAWAAIAVLVNHGHAIPTQPAPSKQDAPDTITIPKPHTDWPGSELRALMNDAKYLERVASSMNWGFMADESLRSDTPEAAIKLLRDAADALRAEYVERSGL